MTFWCWFPCFLFLLFSFLPLSTTVYDNKEAENLFKISPIILCSEALIPACNQLFLCRECVFLSQDPFFRCGLWCESVWACECVYACAWVCMLGLCPVSGDLRYRLSLALKFPCSRGVWPWFEFKKKWKWGGILWAFSPLSGSLVLPYSLWAMG